jgi:hypothetical protein
LVGKKDVGFVQKLKTLAKREWKMSISVSFMRKLEGVAPEIRELFFFSLIEEVEQSIEESVTKNEFNEFKEIDRR